MQQMSIKGQITKEIDVLPLNMQKKVLEFIKILREPTVANGTPGNNLMKFAGIMTEEEADELAQIIEDGCERIDYNDW